VCGAASWFLDGSSWRGQALGRWPRSRPRTPALASIALAKGDPRDAARTCRRCRISPPTIGDDDAAALASARRRAPVARARAARRDRPVREGARFIIPVLAEASSALAEPLADEGDGTIWCGCCAHRTRRPRIARAPRAIHLRLAEVLAGKTRRSRRGARRDRSCALARSRRAARPRDRRAPRRARAISRRGRRVGEVARIAGERRDPRAVARAWGRARAVSIRRRAGRRRRRRLVARAARRSGRARGAARRRAGRRAPPRSIGSPPICGSGITVAVPAADSSRAELDAAAR